MAIETREIGGEIEEDVDGEGIEVLKIFIYKISDLPEFRYIFYSFYSKL